MADSTKVGPDTLETVTENGVTIEFKKCRKQAEQLRHFNPKLNIVREAVLATLRLDSVDKPLLCLDAFAASGIAGLQWKKHLGNKVHIVLATRDVEPVKTSCKLNSVEHSDWLLAASHVTGEWPAVGQKENEVHICPYQAGVILHQEAFNFIFLQANHSTTLYTDSVFSNIRHNGMVCFLSPNISSQCFRSPQLIQRQYQAYVQKTEYVKEMAARVVIADIARAAARHQKGVEVLLTLLIEDHFLIIVRAAKHNQSAVSSAESCRPVLHCLMCEERVVCLDAHSPVENPYNMLPCDCKEKHPGKTAVILGPLWTGDIFSVSYIERLLASERQKNSKNKLYILLHSLLSEAVCRREGEDAVNISENVLTQRSKDRSNSWKEFKDSSCGEPVQKKPKTENGGKSEENSQESVESGDKITSTESMMDKSNQDTKNGAHQEKNGEKTHHSIPIFYYDLKNKKFSGFPKLERLVTILRAGGHQASRTHFEHQAIRTSANIQQLQQVVHKMSCKNDN